MKRFEGKVALITGATRGIGFATARRLALEGARVIITGHQQDDVDRAVTELLAEHLDAEGELHDASVTQQSVDVTQKVIVTYGRLDVIVNNVGGTDLRKDGPVADIDLDYFEEAMRLNLMSMIATTKTALPTMIEQGSGVIVNIASIGGITGDFRGTYYGASKAGCINFCRYVATQYGKKGIRCVGIAPGLILTKAAIDNLDEATRRVFLRQMCVDYFGRPEDIAATAAFLASDEARYITGQTITVDGGLTCHNPTVADLTGNS